MLVQGAKTTCPNPDGGTGVPLAKPKLTHYLRAVPEKRLLEIPMIGPKAVGDIAEALRDPSVHAVDSIEVLGLPPARFISERDRELVRMRQQGATIAAITRRIGISRVRVSQILDRDGW
jgi:hypothetical protein